MLKTQPHLRFDRVQAKVVGQLIFFTFFYAAKKTSGEQKYQLIG